MPKRCLAILSFVERGWRAARECSLESEGEEVRFSHLIKGRLGQAVLAIIPSRPHSEIVSIPRQLFWPAAWARAVGALLSRRLGAVMVDNERSYRRVKRWPGFAQVPVVMVQEGLEGYELWRGSQRLLRAPWTEAAP